MGNDFKTVNNVRISLWNRILKAVVFIPNEEEYKYLKDALEALKTVCVLSEEEVLTCDYILKKYGF